MPGFQVNNLGGRIRHAIPSVEYYYSYTWYIDGLFGEDGQGAVLIHAKDMTLPSFVVNKETVIGASLEYKFAKSVTFDDVKISWYDSVGLIDHLKKWRTSVWSEEKGLQGPGVYKKSTFQTQYLPSEYGSNAKVGYQLYGSWPSSIRHGDLTYTNSEVKLVEVTITYDWAEEYKYTEK